MKGLLGFQTLWPPCIIVPLPWEGRWRLFLLPRKICFFTQCNYPQWGSFTVPGSDFGRCTRCGKRCSPRFPTLLLPPSLPPSKIDSYRQSQGHSVCLNSVGCFSDCSVTEEPLLGETNKRQTSFPGSLKDDACFMFSDLKNLLLVFFNKLLQRFYKIKVFKRYFDQSEIQGTAFLGFPSTATNMSPSLSRGNSGLDGLWDSHLSSVCDCNQLWSHFALHYPDSLPT